jgi:hypothetical protein
MRVLHAPVNIGNQSWVLSRAERAIGLESDLVTNYQTWIGYKSDHVLGTYGQATALSMLRRLWWGCSAPFYYDVLHYNFGRSLLFWDDLPKWNAFPFADLKLAKRLGKRVVMTLQGCDARLAVKSNTRNVNTMCGPGKCSAYESCADTIDAERQRLIDIILPLCDRVFYMNPELGAYVPGATFMPYASVDIDGIVPMPPSERTRPIVVHAPSDPKIKGTDRILAALEALKPRFDFDLVLVKGKTHEEAMRIYRDADLVIDQILAGWYGGFSVEVMALGKPVVCAIRQSDLGVVDPAMRAEMPILNVDPEDLEHDLAAVFERRCEWARIGAAGRRYVERWHHPIRAARALERVYRNPAAPLDIRASE